MLAGAVVFLVPLCALPSMEALKFTSVSSVVLQFAIVGSVVLAAVATSEEKGDVDPVPWIGLSPLAWMRSTPVVTFAFQFHQNVPFVLQELRRDPSDSKWATKREKLQTGMRIAGGTCFLLYATIAVGGTHAFGMAVDKNVLVSLSTPRGLELVPEALVAAVQGAMTAIMVFVFPLNAFGLRVGVHELLLGGGDETSRQRWLSSFALVSASTLVAATVNDLGALFQLIGATTGVCIMFLLPSALMLKLAKRSPSDAITPAAASRPTTAVPVVAAACVLATGLCIGGCGTAAVFITAR